MFKGLSLKIWLPFSLVLFVIAIAFNLYYPKKQEVFYVKNKNNELKELAKTVGLGVELSINEDNFVGLKKTLDFASDRTDFEFIAIVLNGEEGESVFTSYPILPENKILKRQPKEYIYQRSAFTTEDFNGYILIAASKEKMAEELGALNRPIHYSTVLIFFLTFFIYIAIARRITKPLNKLVSVTEDMRDDNFNHSPLQTFTNDEIGQLGLSIHDLQTKLIEQRKRNKELYDGLEDEIKLRTEELEQATKDLIATQRAASLAGYSIDLNSGVAFLPELFFHLIGTEYIESLSIETLHDFVHDTDKLLFTELIENKNRKSDFKKELRFRNTSGKLVWLSISGLYKNELNAGGHVIRGLLHDITERKNYENEINRLSLVAKNTSNCVIITDADRKIVWVNESTQRVTGYSYEEMIGNTPKMFQFEKTDKSTIQLIKEKLAKEENVHCEILNRSKDGKEYWLDLNIVPLFDESKKLYGYIAVETDITPIKEASIELEEREKQLRNILDNSSELIHTLDEVGNVLWANRSWKDTLKVSDSQLKNQNISKFLDSKTKIEFEEVIPKLMKGEEVNDLDCGFYSTNGDLILLKGQTIPLFKDGKFIGSQAYLHNVTQIVKAEQELKIMSNMQEIIMEISFDFLNVDPIDTKGIIANSIVKLGKFMGAENIKTANMYALESILNHEFNFSSITEHTEEIFQSSTNKEGIPDKNNNIHTIPLLRNNSSIGELIVVLPLEKKLLPQQTELLKLYATMLVNVENRYLSASEISAAKREIESINSTLESKVLENTKRNLDLSKTIVDQEKMATIGEISAGIAHDLNTPLGAIKIGAESIGYSIETIFKLFPQLSEKESLLLFKLAESRKIEVFVGGLQLMRETKEMIDYLHNDLQQLSVSNKIAELLVKCRLVKDDKDLIHEILQFNAPEAFLEMLFTVQTTHSMLSSVNDSVTRASEVVQNIRSFIKKDVSSGIQRKEVNIKENIRVVLNIFNYEFKKNVDVLFDIDDQLYIKGFEVKLFQLWSNLIKNAIDAMDNNTSKKLIIKGREEDGKIHVYISNNGPQIPIEIQDQIFKKFFSTKKERNGTGLGLSIVQSVVHDHNALIKLSSTEELTTFCIQFKK
jgi:PAS domain S-box-containing protein